MDLRTSKGFLTIFGQCINVLNYNMIYGLLTKREVKMAGNWPSSFFAFLWTKKTRPISSHLDQTSLVNKDWSICGNKVGNPEQAR